MRRVRGDDEQAQAQQTQKPRRQKRFGGDGSCCSIGTMVNWVFTGLAALSIAYSTGLAVIAAIEMFKYVLSTDAWLVLYSIQLAMWGTVFLTVFVTKCADCYADALDTKSASAATATAHRAGVVDFLELSLFAVVYSVLELTLLHHLWHDYDSLTVLDTRFSSQAQSATPVSIIAQIKWYMLNLMTVILWIIGMRMYFGVFRRLRIAVASTDGVYGGKTSVAKNVPPTPMTEVAAGGM